MNAPNYSGIGMTLGFIAGLSYAAPRALYYAFYPGVDKLYKYTKKVGISKEDMRTGVMIAATAGTMIGLLGFSRFCDRHPLISDNTPRIQKANQNPSKLELKLTTLGLK